jgi:hypothetical protein
VSGFRLDPRRSSQTALQDALVRFGDFEKSERNELTPEEWDVLVQVLLSWVAREARLKLERDELRRRRRAA